MVAEFSFDAEARAYDPQRLDVKREKYRKARTLRVISRCFFAIRNGCYLEVQALVEACLPQVQSFVYSCFTCDYSGWKLDLKGCPFLLFCSLSAGFVIFVGHRWYSLS